MLTDSSLTKHIIKKMLVQQQAVTNEVLKLSSVSVYNNYGDQQGTSER